MKILSFYEFTQLSEIEQYNLVFEKGRLISSSLKGDIEFTLYELFNFYVEVAYHSKDNKVINLNRYMKIQN
ncbi:hypothetical protein [Chryseobacterium populi]|uniref:Uncharacterized protein n=1 Tax=Chryseobacterium populi TaxID=1144316 RepID=J2T867_9FLAO|nr:hypothetical protein [Chryseobacterium populi]EJL74277.1 hypothetical protein PMI13_01010 [Chryseobacterium populi]